MEARHLESVVRASVHYLTTQAEIDQLIAALQALARHAANSVQPRKQSRANWDRQRHTYSELLALVRRRGSDGGHLRLGYGETFLARDLGSDDPSVEHHPQNSDDRHDNRADQKR